MTFRTLVCAALASAALVTPRAVTAMGGIGTTLSGPTLTPSTAGSVSGSRSVNGSSAIAVACSVSSGAYAFTFSTTAGAFSNGATSISTPVSSSGNVVWTTPGGGAATVSCSANGVTSSVLVEIAAPPAAAPVIGGIAGPTGQLFVGEHATFTASATDPQGLALTYAWIASAGTIAGDGASAAWTAPDVAGPVQIQVTVTNAQGLSSSSSVSVPVLFSAYRDALAAKIVGPREISAAPDGALFVVDAGARLHRLTPRGELVATSLGGVSAVAAADGVVFVAVPDGIVKLDPFTGRLLGRIELGAGQRPCALAYDASRTILWMVQRSGTVEGIHPDGTPVRTISTIGSAPLRFPTDVALDAAGVVWVAVEKNEGGSMVHAFDPDTGALIRSIVPSGQGPGTVAIAGGIATDAAGRVYVSDAFSGSVQVVSPTGALLASLGQYGSTAGSLLQPAGLALMANGDLAVANMDVGRIDRFGVRAPLPVCEGDSDCDGLPDAWESANGLDPNDPTDVLADSDGDGLNSAEELAHGTSASSADSDGDGYADGQEIASGFDPTDPRDHDPRVVASGPGSSDPGLVRLQAVVSDPVAGRGPCSTAWSQTSGPAVALRDPATLAPSFVARASGAYRFRAVATCGGVASAPAQVDVAVNNVAPVADGGRLLTLAEGGRATMTGAFSTDANGDALAFVWDQVLGGPVVGTVRNMSFSTRFQAPGYYVFRLAATDAHGAEGATEVPVVVVGAAGPPAAVVSTPVSAQAGDTVVLDASGSYAGAGATFAWTQVLGSTVGLSDPTSPTPAFVAPAPGRYVFEVSVSDAGMRSPPARVDVYVADAGIGLPTAHVAFPGVVAVNAPVSLDGTGSTSASGGALAYAWRQVSGPAGGLTGADGPQASFVAFSPGSYEVELVVSDGGAVSPPARVRFEARAGGKPIPVAVATAAGTAVVGDLVLLNGTGSTGGMRYRWTQVDGPWVAIQQGPVAHFTPTAAGLYGFELEVDDGAVRSAPVRVNVMVFAGGQ